MSDTPAQTIDRLQRISKDVESGEVAEALSKIEQLKLACPICEDYLEASKEILAEAIKMCKLPPNDDDTCNVLKEGAVEVIDFLVEVYTIAKEEDT